MFVLFEIALNFDFTILQAMWIIVFNFFKIYILAMLEVWNEKYTNFDAMCLSINWK